MKLSESQTWRNQDERRYELGRETAQRVLDALTEHLPIVTFGEAPATTLVSTIYFDTADQYYLRRAKAGEPLSSIKVRAREYVPVSDDEERRVLDHEEFCYLERKERRGTIRDKYRVRIAKRDLGPLLSHQQALPEGAMVLQNEIENRELLPAMISMYERRVWGSEGLRITLDERIRYYHAPPKPYENMAAMTPTELGTPDAAGPKRILEVKHSAGEEQAAWLVTLLTELPEATGFSKFIDGMSKLEKHVKRNMKLTRPLYKLS